MLSQLKMAASSALRRHFSIALLALTGVALGIIALEGIVELALRYPSSFAMLYRPTSQINHLKDYYLRYDRAIVQYRSDCTVYDEVLIYKMRPGACTLVNREHTITYTINRAGLRDTDEALAAPAIIVLGDSHAMGWGVAQDLTMARRIEVLTGRKTLNAAIASYETAREMGLLREVAKPATKYVIIAYCDNDYHPNLGAIATGTLPQMDRATFERNFAEHAEAARYFPFKHIWYLSKSVFASFGAARSPQIRTRPGFAAMNFLALLDASRDLLRGRHVIVFDANGYNQNDSSFSSALRLAAARSDLLGQLSAMHVIDASTLLTDDDYFLLDDHIRPSGHDKLAREIAAIIGGSNRWHVEPAPRAVIALPNGPTAGHVDAVQQKGALTLIYGWAARQESGEPAALVALLRDGVVLAETEPVLPRDDIATALGKPGARYAGYALAVRSDTLAGAKIETAARWPDGTIVRLAQ